MPGEESFDFLIYGNCTTNQILRFEEMPVAGKTSMAINAFADECFYGGCAFNVFYAMLRLGLRVRPVLRYSDPLFQDKILRICLEYNLPDRHISGPAKRSYNTCLLLQDKAQRHMTIMYRFGEDSDSCAFYNEPIPVLPEHFAGVRMVMMVMGNPNRSYEILRQIEENGLEFAFSYRNDPQLLPKELLEQIMPRASVIFTNESEAADVSAMLKLADIEELFSTGRAKAIVTTLGEGGSLVRTLTGDGKVRRERVPATVCEREIVDTVGAGDGYVAGFMYGYARGKSPACCAQYGSTVASFVLEEAGSTTNLPTLAQMLERNGRRPDAVNG